MENQHGKISGYRELDQNEINAMNDIKAKGNEVGDLIDALCDHLNVDERWLECARMELQKGFMSLTRSVAKPDFF